eukprot:4094929-Prymnesium_polylepis.1
MGARPLTALSASSSARPCAERSWSSAAHCALASLSASSAITRFSSCCAASRSQRSLSFELRAAALLTARASATHAAYARDSVGALRPIEAAAQSGAVRVQESRGPIPIAFACEEAAGRL